MSIVETIFGDKFFHADDIDGVTITRALNMCTAPGDKGEESSRDLNMVAIKSARRIWFVIRLIALGESFQSVSRQLYVTRKESCIAANDGDLTD